MTRRGAKFMVHVLGTLVGVASVILAGAAWRLAQGPVILTGLTPYIEAALNSQDTGYRFEIGGAELAWGDWQRAFDLRVVEVNVTHEDGTPAFGAAEVLLEMALPPLVRGELRPRGITVIHPVVDVVRHDDGSVVLAMLPLNLEAPAEPAPPGRPDTAGQERETGDDVVTAFLSLRDQPPFDWLDRVSMQGAALRVDDRVLGMIWRAPAAELVLRRRGDGLDLSARATLRSDERTLDLDMVAVFAPSEGTVLMSAHLNDFALSNLSDLVPQLPPLDGLDIVVDGELALAMDTQLHVRSGSFSLSADDGRIDLPDVFQEPIVLGPTRAVGHIRPGFSGLEITQFDLGLQRGEATGRFVIDSFTPAGRIEARFDIQNVPVDDVATYWPVSLTDRARAWIIGHISTGVVTQGSLAFHATVAELEQDELPPGNLVIDVDVSGATVTYLDGMPPVTGIDAEVRIAADAMRIDVTAATLEGLTSRRGVVTMEGLDGDSGMLIGAEASGPVTHAIALLNHPTLGYSSLIALAPEDVSGAIEGRLEIVLPPLDSLKRSDVQFRVAADLSDLALTVDLRGYRAEGGSGTLVFDSRTAVFEGALRLNGVPFEVAYHRSFRTEDTLDSTVQLRGTLDDAERAALGVTAPVDMTGPVGVVLDLAQTAAGSMIWSVVADLTRAAIDFPLLEIDKLAGEPGRAALRLVDDLGPVLHLESVQVAIGTTEISGHGALRASDFSLIRLDVEQLAFGRNALIGSLSMREDGMFDVVLGGGSADLEPMLEDMTGSSGPELPSFRLRGALDRLWLTDNDAVSGVRIDGTYLDDRWESLAVTGSLGEDTPTSLNIWRFSPQERRFEYSAGSAGAAIRAVGLFDHAQGGNLDIRARIDDSSPERSSAGAIRATSFTMTQAPILAQILSIASLGGLSNALSGDGLAFEEAVIPFEKVGDLLTIRDGRAYGPGLGLTIFGKVDLEQNAVDLEGTIVPLYAINAALGQIPLIGDILTGFEEGGGLFGFTYRVTGPRENPEVSVNPLSLLTPGILRRLFSSTPSDEASDFSFEGPRQEGRR